MYKITVPTLITNGRFNKEKTLSEIKRSGAQRIALALGRRLDYAFSADEELKLLGEMIKYFEDNGLETLVWLGETFGHSGGAPVGEQKYQNIHQLDFGAIGAFCPMDKQFTEDFCTWVKNVAKCGAKMIMLDDDFRLGFRGGLGCCCPLHMEAVCKELGEDISADELKIKAFAGGKNKYRDAWLKAQGNSMREFSKKLREALDTVNPDARLGFCCSPNAWDTDGADVFELAKIMSGKTKPFIRLIGAPYWVAEWNGKITIGDVVEYERMQIAWRKNRDIEIMTEGDTYPRPRFTTSAATLECFDLLLRADGKSDGMLKYMLDYVSDADYETGYVDFSVDNMWLYGEIERLFSGKKAVGVRPAAEMHILEFAELNADEPELLNNIQRAPLFNPAIHFAVRNSLPISYDEGGVNIIFGEYARNISEDLLSFGSIIDIDAAKILMARGIDVGIISFKKDAEHIKQNFTDLPNEYYCEEGVYTRLAQAGNIAGLVLKEGAEVITEFKVGSRVIGGAYHYMNKNGQKFLVYPFSAKKSDMQYGWFDTYARRRQVEKSIAWLSDKPLDVSSGGDYPMLYIMEKKNENSIAVAVCNLFTDKIKNAKIKVNTEYRDVEFVNCTGHREGNNIVLDNILYPYEFAAFELNL